MMWEMGLRWATGTKMLDIEMKVRLKLRLKLKLLIGVVDRGSTEYGWVEGKHYS